MLLLLSFGFASTVTKHNTLRSCINPGFKATRNLQGGEVPPVPSTYQDRQQTRATSHILQEECGSLRPHAWESYSRAGSVTGTSIK